MSEMRAWLRKLLAATVALSLALPGVAGGAPEEAPGPSERASSAGRGSAGVATRGRESARATVRLAVLPGAKGVAGLKGAGAALGFAVGRSIPHLKWTGIDVPAVAADAVAASLVKRGLATKVERDLPTYTAYIPNDTSFPSMWQLNNTGQSGGTPDADIDAPEAWDVQRGSSAVIVAIVDTGVQLAHPDLAGNAWVNPADPANGIDDDGNGLVDDVNGWDFVHNDKTVYDAPDGDQHGTHVAGTIGAAGDNELGVTGINHDVSIMSLKTIGPVSGSLLDAAEAITYAVDHGATVINHSWTSPGTIGALDSAIAYASSHGVINVAAAGNEGTRNDELPYYPASSSDPNVIAVAATDDDDLMPWWSDWGTSVDLAAPGVTVYSTLPNSYGTMSGTSMATPHVTGAVALLRGAFPAATIGEIRARLLETVDRPTLDHGPAGRVASNGRLNLASALAPEIAATPSITSPVAGAELTAGLNASASWTPSPLSSAASSYELQAGVESTAMATGFETGIEGWTPGGAKAFYRSSTKDSAHTGSFGVRSGAIADLQMSTISTTVSVPPGGGMLSFWYWLDSEDTYDIAYLTVDGVDTWGMNYDRPWTLAEVPLSGGTHELQWTYQKDESAKEGADAFGIDDVTVTGWTWGAVVSAPAGATSGTFMAPSQESDSAALRVRAVVGGQRSNWAQVSNLRTVETVPPSVPTGLAAVSLDRRVDLTWDVSPDLDFDRWQVWRAVGAGEFLLHTTVSSPEYSDTAVTNGVSYRYRLVAEDEGGHASLSSSEVEVTPLDVWVPAAPTGLIAAAGDARIRLDWDAAPEPDVIGWEVWRSVDGGVPVKVADTANRWYDDLVLPPGSSYSYEVYAVDDDDNRSTAANVSDIPLDLQPPAAPTGLTGEPLDCAVRLTWDPAPEPDLGVWQVWRAEGEGEFALLDETTVPTYTDTGLTNGVTYRYYLVPFDHLENVGPPSSEVDVTPLDVWAPTAPTGLAASSAHERASIAWDDAPEPDFDHWEVWRSEDGTAAVKVADPVLAATFAEDGLKSRVPYEYGVIAVDDDGLRSAPASVTVVPLDTQAPAAPTGLRSAAYAGKVTLAWNAAPEPDVNRWEVWRSASGGAFAQIAQTTTPAYTDAAVDNTVVYAYKVVARDLSANRSTYSAAVTAVPRATLARVQGANRYATAIAVSASTFAAGSAKTVVLATGESFPDALSASALAGCYRGPLLLTPAASLPAGLTGELARLGATDVVIVGGTSAVSASVERALARSYRVTRISGRDRYDTAAKVALAVKGLGGGSRVFIARGDTFPDALSASPAAYAKRYPVVLVQSRSVPAVTRAAVDALHPTDGVVLGSTGAVSAVVGNSLGIITTRWGGSTRYETSAIVATEAAKRGWTSFAAAGIATGQSFPDALGGGAAIGKRGGVLLLTPGTTLAPNASNAIRANVRNLDAALVIGGTSAVSAGVERAMRGLLGL